MNNRPIQNEDELKKSVEQVDELLQQIQDYCIANGKNLAEYPIAKIRFPRKFIRPADEQRNRLPFIRNEALKKNLSYTLILSDVLLWIVIRTDLWGIPKEMLIKLNLFLLGSMCESITKDFLKGICGKPFEKRTEFLADKKIISNDLEGEINWVWEIRNKMHLFQLEKPEYINDYTIETNKRAVLAFRSLIAALTTTKK